MLKCLVSFIINISALLGIEEKQNKTSGGNKDNEIRLGKFIEKYLILHSELNIYHGRLIITLSFTHIRSLFCQHVFWPHGHKTCNVKDKDSKQLLQLQRSLRHCQQRLQHQPNLKDSKQLLQHQRNLKDRRLLKLLLLRVCMIRENNKDVDLSKKLIIID